MVSSSFSHHASANQANHASTQVNGNIGPQLSINNAFFDILKGTSIENLSSALPSIKEEFYFGPIPALEEDQDDDDQSKPILRLPPSIRKDDVEYISGIGIKILQKYKLILDHTTGVRATCVKHLRQKAKDQRTRIDLHVKVIAQWPQFPAKPQRGDASIHVSQDISLSSSKTDDLKRKLGEIHDKLKDAVNPVPRIPKQSQSRPGESAIKRSKVFRDLTRLFEQTELDIAAIESQVYQSSGYRWPFETTKGFARLYVSSSITRTLYRHLCQACPLSGQVQGHGHTALVGLVPVPEKEPLCIVPDEVAVASHHVAIESTFIKGDYIWFEAQSKLLLPGGDNEAVYSEPSSPQAVVIDGLRQRLRRNSEYSSASVASSGKQVQLSQKGSDSGDFCRVQVCPGSLAQGNDRLLAMCIGDDQENGHQIFYLDEKKRPKTSCRPLNLAEIIEQGEDKMIRLDPTLFKRSRALRSDRFKIALKIAEATLRYGWREWLGDAWGIRDIKFYPVESERMPFLRAEIFNHGCGRLEKFMANLGFVLLQLGLWQLRTRATGPIYDKELEKQLNRLGSEVGAPYQEAVRYCMGFAGFDDRDLHDNDIFQQTFYQKVVSPLREMVMRTEDAESEMLGKPVIPE
ncbi:hypothetical protein FSARC_11324 [Fusarium sarcochroum]|uniref:Uncharacterized protein n=1 Tax=Fusarium sarcochroum TaxID=1208366 RepID=A0A8H4X0I8_9HYPO|nr:hypothetical protein FSARC_11324 [Fusarium sarcochroum]